MNEEKFLKMLQHFSDVLPHFPDGRIDYSHSESAPVVTVFVRFDDKLLLLKRSNEVSTYQGKWNTVAGYLDEVRPLKDKVYEELAEEVSVKEPEVAWLKYGEPFEYIDDQIGRTWIVHPVLAFLTAEPKIVLDREHTEYTWIHPKDFKNYDIVANLTKSWERVSN